MWDPTGAAQSPKKSQQMTMLNLYRDAPSQRHFWSSDDTISSFAEENEAAYELSPDHQTEAEAFLGSSSSTDQNKKRQQAYDSENGRFSWKQKLVPCLFLVIVLCLFGLGPHWNTDMKWNIFGSKGQGSSSSTTGKTSDKGMRNVAYYVNWAIYGCV